MTREIGGSGRCAVLKKVAASIESTSNDRRGVLRRRLCCLDPTHVRITYDKPERVIHQWKELSFIMCGVMVNAKPDVCVISESSHLLVQEGKRGTSRTDPEPQLIAHRRGDSCLLSQNNLHRKTAGLPMMDSQVIPESSWSTQCRYFVAYPSPRSSSAVFRSGSTTRVPKILNNLTIRSPSNRCRISRIGYLPCR
ncbi:hypothetical protein EDB85DRAFT_57214 [Lactarius pseudohatsudake]|nr:hypothetical protein EDB85DRAFT_57214 [Lactarius pseudohatsudake]